MTTTIHFQHCARLLRTVTSIGKIDPRVYFNHLYAEHSVCDRVLVRRREDDTIVAHESLDGPVVHGALLTTDACTPAELLLISALEADTMDDPRETLDAMVAR